MANRELARDKVTFLRSTLQAGIKAHNGQPRSRIIGILKLRMRISSVWYILNSNAAWEHKIKQCRKHGTMQRKNVAVLVCDISFFLVNKAAFPRAKFLCHFSHALQSLLTDFCGIITINLYSRTDTDEKWINNNYNFGINDCRACNLWQKKFARVIEP